MNAWAQRAARLLAWRSGHQAVRWIGALILFTVALRVRFALGLAYGANPALTFYPAVLAAFVLFGWMQAAVLLLAFVVAGILWFLPPNMPLQPVGWVVVGGCNIAILAGLEHVVAALVTANDRQRLLFQEMQHRTANTLQAASGSLRLARIRMEADPSAAARLLDDAAQRIEASANVHRRLTDPVLFGQGLRQTLKDAVSSIIDVESVGLSIEVDELALAFDQMSTITMLVIELANNAQKHVFRERLGKQFMVKLQRRTEDSATLIIRDDGPGTARTAEAGMVDDGLGLEIVRGLVAQLHGRLSMTPGRGTEFIIEFPLAAHRRGRNVS
ncbi:MAG: sensor histidine kinase [Proteobacteria bacterium]|nr:sensor histidine kinase [Pseudomonadota bacterium]